MRLVVSRPTPFPGTHTFDVVLRASIKCCVVWAGRERFCHPAILYNLPHLSAVILMFAPENLVVIGLYNYFVEGFDDRFYFYASVTDFAVAAAVAVPMGGTIASSRPPLMEVIEAAVADQSRSPVGVLVPTVAVTAVSYSACVIVNLMSLKAASGCSPGGSSKYPWGKVVSQ